jgi:hypothetical protein
MPVCGSVLEFALGDHNEHQTMLVGIAADYGETGRRRRIYV